MEKIPLTTDYPDTRLFKLLARHVTTDNNLRRARAEADKEANPRASKKADRVGGYQPRARVAACGYAEAEAFALTAPGQLATMLGGNFFVARLSASPADRTQFTAQVVQANWPQPEVHKLAIHIDPNLRELCKGRWPFGHQGWPRTTVETAKYKERRRRRDWDFAHGWPGLRWLSGADTERQAGARVLSWFLEKPPVPQEIVDAKLPIVDIGFSHGMSGVRGVAMALHRNPDKPGRFGISVKKAERPYEKGGYKMDNASGYLLGHEPDAFNMKMIGRILLPSQPDACHKLHPKSAE